MKITMAHGSGGEETSRLIEEIFAKRFANPVLDCMEDAAVVEGSSRIAVTTDSFVVTPLFFPGGDIGRLSVCGTVNDLLMSGAKPKYLTCGFILEEGADTEQLEQIADSMAKTALEAAVQLVAGDTKVVEGSGGIYINTAGVGFVPPHMNVGADQCCPGDIILVSGDLGDHHAAILSARMGISNSIVSDCAPLVEMTERMEREHVRIRAMRDITRGGLGTILNEWASKCGLGMIVEEEKLPVNPQVREFCGILGLDPLHMGNEGKMVAVVAPEDGEKALACIRASRYGQHAALIGTVAQTHPGIVTGRTSLGGERVIPKLYGEGLPRIC